MAERRHERQLIREAAVAALLGTEPDYNTAARDRVFETRVVPFNRKKLPAISVYSLSESVDPESAKSAPRELKRSLTLAIEAAVIATESMNLDDALDEISLEIEIALHRDDSLGGKVSDLVLSGTELDVVGDGENPVGVARLSYSATYYTYAPDARDDILEDEFSLANIRHNPGNSLETANEAVDRLEDFREDEE